MKCPRDGAALAAELLQGSALAHRCPSCDGLWLQRGAAELAQAAPLQTFAAYDDIDVIAGAYEMARQKALPRPACPSCSGLLDAAEFAYCSQILIDRCAKCRGIWLDRGELNALTQFLQRETRPRENAWPIILDTILTAALGVTLSG